MVSVLFVCMGNICRSPMGEGVFRAAIKRRGLDLSDFKVDSAGTIGYHAGNPPDARAAAICSTTGVDISDQRSRKVTDQDFEDFDYIICMDRDNLADLMRRSAPHHHDKLYLFLDFGEGLETDEVPDPYYGRDDGFSYCLTLIENASDGLLDHILRK